jgi:hypothetical protein
VSEEKKVFVLLLRVVFGLCGPKLEKKKTQKKGVEATSAEPRYGKQCQP